ncbi:glycosyltransferase family 4 protein [Nitrospira moscoviensis]|uniref:Glycosyl transferase family 1 domain-containing protein n=1 Tax=Nitrospira moscoviensis TaxID=42253 RepID=A0A0K2GGE1_NITMO|nr:glycosyltransferase family 4 protein [Nitrospira moscoviensis]ALA59899.1 hypothetical protein NITMOv2_3507 [Nitrospira moscoviensis]
MKVLFVAGDVKRIGGIEKYNKDFVYALSQAGATISLVQRREGGFMAKASFLCRFLFTFVQHRPDIIFCGHLNFSPVCIILKSIWGTPYTLALYGIEVIKVNGLLKRQGVLGAQLIITISEYTKDLILRQFPEKKDQIFMLPSAVDGSIFHIKEKSQSLIEKFNIAGRPVILSLARLATSEHKGQDRVLRSFPRVLKRIPDAVYLIVGSGHDDRVNTLLHESSVLDGSVIVAGPISDSERVDYYNLADVFVLPSKFEGFGIVFIESLACGVPVVASDGYGCREGLLNGEIGLLVNPDDTKMIADTIVEVLEKRASERFCDREYLRRRTLEVYGMAAWNERVKMLLDLLCQSEPVKARMAA